jgi:tripartite-type tricarboxylate transporter receptor subunit TctC
MKRLGLILLSAACLALGMASAPAQDKYPSRPIKVIVPYAPGGATDIVARIVGDEMNKLTGQGFVVLNKPGAFGMLAIDELVKSEPDGYTLMIGNVSTNTITPILYANKMNSDYSKSVAAVTNLVDVPAFFVVATANGFPAKTLPELIGYAKQNPGKVVYGTVGIGSYPHYDMAYFGKRAGDLDMIAIHNKAGAAGVINDMITGDMQAAFLNVASTAAMIKAGKLRPLAVVNHQRLPDYPEVPTMAEVGFPDVGTVAWNAMFAPAGTPKPVLETLHKAAAEAMQAPAAKEALAKQHFNIVPSKSVDEAKTWLAGEIGIWKKITAEVKVEAE